MNLTEHFHYTDDAAGELGQVLLVDSANSQGTDSVYFLNRMSRPCAACPVQPPKYLVNQPGFLQKEMRISATGDRVTFHDPETWVLFPKASFGQSWTFDTLAGVQATVTSTGTQQLWGATDSVKTILLSTTDSIVLSKTHGVLHFPDLLATGTTWSLQGIRGRDVGDLFPQFDEMYRAQPGDAVEWLDIYGDYDPLHIKEYRYHRKFTVIQRTQFPDSLRLTMQAVGRDSVCLFDYFGNFVCHFTGHVSYVTDWVFQDSMGHPANRYPLEMQHFRDRHQPDFQPPYYDAVSPMLSEAPAPGFVQKSYGYHPQSVSGNRDLYEAPQTSDTLSTTFSGSQTQGSEMYLEGFGLAEYDIFVFSSGWRRILLGATLAGDTLGVVNTDSLLLHAEGAPFASAQMQIYPNPVTERTRVILEIPGKKHLKLYDIKGRLQYEMHWEGSEQTMDLGDLPAGLYLAKLRDEDGNAYTQKVLKR